MRLGRITDAPEIHGDREGSTNRRVQLGTNLLEGWPPLQRAVPKCQLHFNFRQFLQQRRQRSSDMEKKKILLWIWKSAMWNDLNLYLVFNRENFLKGSSLLKIWEKWRMWSLFHWRSLCSCLFSFFFFINVELLFE